jgi:hypothetical protein
MPVLSSRKRQASNQDFEPCKIRGFTADAHALHRKQFISCTADSDDLFQGLIVDSKPFDAKQGFAIVKAASLRGVFRRHDSSPIAILSLRLHGFDQRGDPSALIKAYLRPYFQDTGNDNPKPLRHSSVTFNIQPESLTSIESNQAAIDGMAQKIRQ